jgi:hypothetical protein
VVVSCGSGISRSPAFLVMWAMYKYHQTFAEAYHWLIVQHVACPDIGAAISPGFTAQADYREGMLLNWHVADGL